LGRLATTGKLKTAAGAVRFAPAARLGRFAVRWEAPQWFSDSKGKELKMARSIGLLAIVPLAMALSLNAAAGWSLQADENTPIADRTGEQTLPKVAVTSDGGCYIGWFDHAFGGYQVFLQRLDAQGNEMWPHNGILVSDHPQDTWLTDWDLIADASGNAVLAFVDLRAGGDWDVYAYCIAPDGSFVWGADGIAVTDDTMFQATPRVAEMSDGGFVFVWSGDGGVGVKRLSAAGAVPFSFMITSSGETPGFPRVVAADAGACIISWVRNIAYTGLKHIRAQKYDVLGQPQWGASPKVVFDGGSVPMAYEPVLAPDGAGGAVVAWHYSPSSMFQALVQRLTAAGGEVFAHNGVQLSTLTTRHHIDPAIAFHPDSGEIFAVWNERSESQGLRGVYAQRISAAGARLWGSNGVELTPVDSVIEDFQRAVPCDDGMIVVYFQEPGPSMASTVIAERLNATGDLLWGPKAICSVLSDKGRLPVTKTAAGMVIAAWEDDRAGAIDIYAQNVNPNGSLGPLADLNCDGLVNGYDIDPFVLALTDPAAYAGAYPECDSLLADCNGDGAVNGYDIDPFVDVLIGP
jgi:hypothetical protein